MHFDLKDPVLINNQKDISIGSVFVCFTFVAVSSPAKTKSGLFVTPIKSFVRRKDKVSFDSTISSNIQVCKTASSLTLVMVRFVLRNSIGNVAGQNLGQDLGLD